MVIHLKQVLVVLAVGRLSEVLVLLGRQQVAVVEGRGYVVLDEAAFSVLPMHGAVLSRGEAELILV